MGLLVCIRIGQIPALFRPNCFLTAICNKEILSSNDVRRPPDNNSDAVELQRKFGICTGVPLAPHLRWQWLMMPAIKKTENKNGPQPSYLRNGKSPQRRRWRRRILYLAFGCIIGCVAWLVWTISPLLSPDGQQCNLSVDFDGDDSRRPPVMGMGLTRMAMGWFHGVEPFRSTKRVLILGFDDDVDTYSGRTDVIIVVEVDPSKGIGIISIPRDLWVTLPPALIREPDSDGIESGETDGAVRDTDDITHNRINTIYRVGNRYLGKGKGHRALKKVLANELDLTVDFTVAIDYRAVHHIIDALGGITVDVPCPIKDNFVSRTSPSGYESLDVPAGKHTFSGQQAMLFMRSRHGRTDMDRSRRQQLILGGLRDRMMDDTHFLGLPRLAARMMRYVKTDTDMETILRLAATARRMRGRVHGMVMGTPVVNRMTTADGKSVLVLNGDIYRKRRKNLYSFSPEEAQPPQICPNADVALNWRERKRNPAVDSDETR